MDFWIFGNWTFRQLKTIDTWTPGTYRQLNSCDLLDIWKVQLSTGSDVHKFSFPKNQMSSSCYGEKTASSEFIFSALGASDRTLMAIKQPIIIFYYSKGTFLQCCVSRNLNIDRFNTIYSVWKKFGIGLIFPVLKSQNSQTLKQTCSKKLLI